MQHGIDLVSKSTNSNALSSALLTVVGICLLIAALLFGVHLLATARRMLVTHMRSRFAAMQIVFSEATEGVARFIVSLS